MSKSKFLIQISLVLALVALSWGVDQASAQYVPPPQLVPGINYLLPNYANSPVLTKFVNGLPGLTPAGANNIGQYLPVAVPMGTATPAGVPRDGDYYEIAIVDWLEQMHSDMGQTKIRGYVQIEPPGTAQPPGSLHVQLFYPDGVTPITFGGQNVYAYDKPHYLGPVIVATKGVPTRIKFYNLLATSANGGDMFIPVDTTLMGAGPGPNDQAANCSASPLPAGCFSQNRAVIHLHGGDNPWVSDGTLHQWITPAGDPTNYPKGASEQSVADMPVPPLGSTTLYFTNGQSGRLLFYHEHAQGLTRLGPYVGTAAGYLLTDTTERALNSYAPGGEIPMVVQDRTFVSDGTLPAGWPAGAIAPAPTLTTDPTWALDSRWGQTKGSFWFPHVYMPNQNPNDITGANPMGRWDYGPWFWPVFPVVTTLPQTATGPLPSAVPESFVDTPIVNGTAYPVLNVNPTTYRFRVLSVGNERYFNLQLYVASPIVSGFTITNPGSGYTAPPAITITPAVGDITGYGATAQATIDPTTGAVTAITLTTVGSSYTAAPTVTIGPPPAGGTQATATATLYTALTEVGMVPADKMLPPPGGWPAWWMANDTPGMTPNILDGRPGGVPDPRTMGPSFVHIGTEGGISPQAVVLPNTPIGYEQNKRSVTVLNTYEHTLFLGPAERADVMVDFSAFAGKTLIMYNDAPAPLPAGDPRNDYYTGNPDNTAQGGAPTTIAGFGPNTRTIMQINVANTAPAAALNVAALSAAVSSSFGLTQPKPVVPETAYTAADGAPPSGTDVYAKIADTSLTFSPYSGTPEYTGSAITVPLQPKTIQELFDPIGRMNASLGVEIPFTTATVQTTLPMGVEDPPTEVIADNTTQLWKITHNGVDTHVLHFHLFNVQVVNRVGWDGAIKPPWPEEVGWKESVKMNPLEDIVVALRVKIPTVPFQQPNSVRPLSPANPIGAVNNYYGAPIFLGVDPNNNPVTITNQFANFGHEYVWHCHLLGHEENDMMRAVSVAVAPLPPSNLSYTVVKGKAVLTWQDNSPDETAYMVQVKYGTGAWTTLATVPGGTLTYTDGTFKKGAVYQVIAVNSVGSGVPGYPMVTAYSLPSNQAAAPLGVTTITSVTQALAVGSPVVVKWTYSATDATGFTVQRSTSNTFPANSTTTVTGTPTLAGGVYTLNDTGVVVGLRRSTTYYYRVTPTNANGSGAPSNIVSLLVHP